MFFGFFNFIILIILFLVYLYKRNCIFLMNLIYLIIIDVLWVILDYCDKIRMVNNFKEEKYFGLWMDDIRLLVSFNMYVL